MNLKHRADEILGIQKEAIQKLQTEDSWVKSIELIKSVAENKGRIVTTGMGKAGIIGKKMSATLASIGIPSFYVHPAEALHGDLGRISSIDLVIVFSHSGSTAEVRNMITHLHGLNDSKNTVIVISGNADPQISYNHLVCYGDLEESSNVKKVPSTSTTIMLMIADVLAITAAESLGFNDDWFKKRHPGGAIGESYENTENH
ncbi:MAG: SIS domain-containing protein [Promethearchaeota archaeon]